MKEFRLQTKTITVLVAFAVSGGLMAVERDIAFEQNFENSTYFNPEKISERNHSGRDRWRRLGKNYGHEIVVFPESKYHQSLKITRLEKLTTALFYGRTPLPDGHDYTVGFDIYLESNDGLFINAQASDGKAIGGVTTIGGAPLKVLNDGQWRLSEIIVPEGWSRVEMDFSPNDETYKVRLIAQDKSVQTDGNDSMGSTENLKEVMVGTVHPTGRKAVIDNLRVDYARVSSIKSRRNVTNSADLFFQKKKIDKFPIQISENRAELVIELPVPADVSSLRIVSNSQMEINAGGVNIGGQMVPLAGNKDFIRNENSYQADFTPGNYNKVTISIEVDAEAEIQGVELYETNAYSQVGADKRFADLLCGDFDLPVYADNAPANLCLTNKGTDELPVKLELRERNSNQLVMNFPVKILTPGENQIEIPIDKLPNGEFFAELFESGQQPVKGRLRRLLRRQAVAETPPPEIINLSGQKLFFPDAYYLDSVQNLRFRQGHAKAWQVSRSHMTPDAVMQHGEGIYMQNGKICAVFFTLNGKFQDSSKKQYLAIADPDDLSKWEIQALPANYRHPTPCAAMHGEVAVTDNKPKPDASGKIEYRFYDPDRDGKVQVNQVEIKYIRFSPPGTMGYSQAPVVDDFSLPQRTTWAIWHKEPGLSLVLTRQPFLIDGYPGDFENGNESNDNFVGQYFSDDGKTLFYARGRLIRRYDQFNVPYENFKWMIRLITVFKTSDGINWTKTFMALPERNEPIGTQHYGGAVFRIPHGLGLRVAFVYRYYAHEQRYGLDLNYSHDGFVWKRFPDEKLWLDNGPPGSWNAGSIHISRHGVDTGDQIVQMLNWCSSGYHFYPGPRGYEGFTSETAESVKRRFEPLQVKKWPLFKHFGSYEKMAEDIRALHINAGVMSFRKDGFFCLEADDQPGNFITMPITASGKLTVNARVGESGYLRINLLDVSGTNLPGSECEINHGDFIDEVQTLTLPATPFKIAVEMKDCRLYTLGVK